MFPKLKTSGKSVQTTRVVSSNFSCSLYRLRLKSPERYAQVRIYLRVLISVSVRTYKSHLTKTRNTFHASNLIPY